MSNPISITKPFCNLGTPNVDYQLPPKNSAYPIVTQDQCYPEQQEEPLDAGGTPVSRSQTNGLWYVATDNIAFQTLGGFYTFNQDVITNNGGYPVQAILWCASNSTFQISLKDQNTANFVTNPEYINDGTNWKTLISSDSSYVHNGGLSGMNNNQLTLGMATDNSKMIGYYLDNQNQMPLGTIPTSNKPDKFAQVNVDNVFTGINTFSNVNHFTGSNTFTAANTFNSINTFTAPNNFQQINIGSDIYINPTTGIAASVPGASKFGIKFGWANGVLRYIVDNNASTIHNLANASDTLGLLIYYNAATHGSSVDWTVTTSFNDSNMVSAMAINYPPGGGDQRSRLQLASNFSQLEGQNSTNSNGNAIIAVRSYRLSSVNYSEDNKYYLTKLDIYNNIAGTLMGNIILDPTDYIKELTIDEYNYIIQGFSYTDKFIYYNSETQELYEDSFPLEFQVLCNQRVNMNLLLATDKYVIPPYNTILTSDEQDQLVSLREEWAGNVNSNSTDFLQVNQLPDFLTEKLKINLNTL